VSAVVEPDPAPVVGRTNDKCEAILQEHLGLVLVGCGSRLEVPMEATLRRRWLTEWASFTFGSQKRIYTDEEAGDALFATLSKCVGSSSSPVPDLVSAFIITRCRHSSASRSHCGLSVASEAVSSYRKGCRCQWQWTVCRAVDRL